MLRKWEKDGFYVALPTAATSNQMVSRLREWFAANDILDQVRLLHGMAWMVDDDTCEQRMNTEDHEEITRWLAPLRRGLLGQFAVGTIDQAMLSVTKARYGVLRLLGLSNKVLVIDEIHSYDVYMGEFILLLLQWCKAMEIPVVMLSATLPPKLKAKLLSPYTSQPLSEAYPMITAVCEDGSVEEIPIEKTVKNMEVSVGLLPILNDPEKIAHKAAELTESGGCICVLMNTVRQAQNVFSALERSFDGKLLLFHAQFPAGKRNEIEQECIRLFGKDKSQRPQKAILVATQVVEQSLDVDFDAMLTAVAPMDLVLQRMGRIFRHDDTIRPKHFQTPAQWILIPDGENFGVDAYVYPEVLLRQTAHLLAERNTVKIPGDLAPLVAAGYDDSKVPPEECEKWIEHVLGEQIEAGQSRKYLIGAPDKIYSALGDSSQLFDDEGENKYLTVQTRLGEPSVRIALLEPELYAQVAQCTSDGVAKVRDRKLAEQVLQQSVSVAKRRISFPKCDLLDTMGAMLLAGVKIYPAQNGCCEFPGGRICFDSKLGLVIEEEK
jgi:CRISPR-associated endonuclease/helicase Cas3